MIQTASPQLQVVLDQLSSLQADELLYVTRIASRIAAAHTMRAKAALESPVGMHSLPSDDDIFEDANRLRRDRSATRGV
jgi:hypothetical protein